MALLNIAFYKFTPLARLPELRARWLSRCGELGLKGTILLSTEGINASLAGHEKPLRAFVAELEGESGIGKLELKESSSDSPPFSRMFVKIKKEIISTGRDDLRPSEKTGRRIAPRELARWLEQRRDIVLLDTRNRYEIEHGTFVGARDLGLANFREFGPKLSSFAEELRAKTVVMFCTGGIRCEKATALALQENFSDVYQLDGGILRYFEECGGEHFRGRCFVFDERVSVAPTKPSLKTMENGK